MRTYQSMEQVVDAQIEADYVEGKTAELMETLNIALNAQMWDVVVSVLVEAHALLGAFSGEGEDSMAAARARQFLALAVDEVRCATARPLN